MQLNEETIESSKNLFNKLEKKTAPKTGASISKKRSEFALERVYEMEIFLLSLLIHKNRPYNYCFIGSCLASIVLQKTNQLVRQRPNAAMLGSQRIKLSPRSLLNFNIIYNGWAAQKRVELIGEPSDQIDSFERVLEPVEAEKTHGNSAAFHEVKGQRNEFKCKICKKKLSSKSSLNLHRRVHTGETPHRCPYCNEMFRWYTSFKRHMKAHNKDMVCPVNGCGEKFKTKSEVDEHCENIHIANISQPEESRE